MSKSEDGALVRYLKKEGRKNSKSDRYKFSKGIESAIKNCDDSLLQTLRNKLSLENIKESRLRASVVDEVFLRGTDGKPFVCLHIA